MKLVAVTRDVSPSLERCELSFHVRQPIDVSKAISQHEDYRKCLAELGVRVISLPPEPGLPDSVFVEDAAVVLDELAVITRIGAASRREEAKTLVPMLSQYRPVKFLNEPATLDGGDVLVIGRRIYIGLSRRTNGEGIRQLTEILQPHGYIVHGVEVSNCLHLKSACSSIGNNTLLINRSLINPEPFCEFELLDVGADEPAAANALRVNEHVIMAANFPNTRNLLEKRGLPVHPIDVSELQKAEAGVTCCSVIFNSD